MQLVWGEEVQESLEVVWTVGKISKGSRSVDLLDKEDGLFLVPHLQDDGELLLILQLEMMLLKLVPLATK